ncbi:MAG: hypothetical protein PUC04_03390 [Firmicutes bacterium]|nr:hypothetical protein [Bacillota bacterium]MDY2808789.1 hypothetical protein [Oscillospiraceae bacterium]
MIEQDTIRLLRECDAGIQMGVSAIDDVLERVQAPDMYRRLSACKRAHESLKTEINVMLADCHDDGKAPNPLAQGMSWLKTNAAMAMNGSDQTIASLMTDGCNMGVKSLGRYLNQYEAASEDSKDITKRLIGLEQKLSDDLREYL